MTDNSAEREAEKILEEAYAEARAEECPQGRECAVHFRVDEEYIDEDQHYARFITYQGEYVVVTDDNHEYGNPAFILRAALGLLKKEDLPPRFETVIIHVGEGALGDITPKGTEAVKASIRYVKKHDSWGGLKDEHALTVTALREGLIDLSKPVEG